VSLRGNKLSTCLCASLFENLAEFILGAIELLVACYDSRSVVRITSGGKLRETISHDDAGGAFNSPNDLAVGSVGGVYLTGSGSRTFRVRFTIVTPPAT
jgi:sugar lactone lactonase YvrE